MVSPSNPKEAKERIETWLKEEGYSYSPVTGEQASNTLFNHLVHLPDGKHHVNIFQPSTKEDSISVSTGLLFTEEQRKGFSQKTRIERDEILSEMRFKLASIDVEFGFINGQMPKAMQFTHPIYYDALTKDRFFKAITTVFKAFKIASWAFGQSL